MCFSLVLGFNPAWNENSQFDVYVPELALVRFVVEDFDSMSDNDFVAQYTLPFNSIQMGKLRGAIITTEKKPNKTSKCFLALLNDSERRRLSVWA